MSDEYYPPGGFYFEVNVIGSLTVAAALTRIDASFQEVSGIEAQFDVEAVVEGGENRFVHQLPKLTKYSDLVLKRGIVTKDSVIAEWVGQTIGSRLSIPVIPQNLLVTLLNDKGMPTVAWGFVNAYPLRWEVAPMKSMDNQVLTETLVFSYNYFERVNLGGLGAAAKLAQFAAGLA